MVQLIVGDKGKGKTKYLLDKVNTEIKTIGGNIVFLDKDTDHMYELNNKVRLINVSEFLLDSTDMFTGFVSGIASQDHDLQQIYIDSFLKVAKIDAANADKAIAKLEKLSAAFGIDFVLSIAADESALAPALKENIIVSL